MPVLQKNVLPIVAVALFDVQGRILIQKRSAGKSLAGLWEFPGGKIEAGETPEAALTREIGEELDLNVEIADLYALGFSTWCDETMNLLLLLFGCERWTGTPVLLDAEEIAWVEPTQLRRYPMPPADLPLIELLINRAASALG